MINLTAVPVVIPDLSSARSVMPTMGSIKDVPLAYTKAYGQSGGRLAPDSLTTITEPAQIAVMLEQWFFRGLLSIRLNLKPGAVSCDSKTLLRFVGEILQDCEPQHEHKMSFLTWVVHTCCESVTYQRKA